MSDNATTDRWMHALRAHHRGGPDQLLHEPAPLPAVGIGDVLVSVQAASFTPTELGWPSTWVDRLGRDRRPVIPAHEVSGVVAALGFGTTGLAVGDEVYGLTDWYRDGAAADYVAVEARNLAPKPAALDHVQAAAVPLAALTAWQALFDHGRLMAGQTALIHGAAGGVGSFAVQLANAAGARVVATGRSLDPSCWPSWAPPRWSMPTSTGSRRPSTRSTWCSTWSAGTWPGGPGRWSSRAGCW